MVWETTKHIASWGDLWQSLVNHYTLHGGRMVTVFFLDLFLWMGKLPFDIANAAVFTGVLILLYFHAARDTKLTAEPGILALAALFMWLSLPHFGVQPVGGRESSIGAERWQSPCSSRGFSADGLWKILRSRRFSLRGAPYGMPAEKARFPCG